VILVVVVIVTAPFSTPRQAGPASWVGGATRVPPPGASVVGTGGSSTVKSDNPESDPHELPAEKAATQLLEEVQVPAGAIQVSTLPAGTPDMSSPPVIIGFIQVVDDHRFWIVPGNPTSVLAWFAAEHLPESVQDGSGTEGDRSGPQYAFVTFSFSTSTEQALNSRELMIGVARDHAGQLVVRADTQIGWEPTRPPQSLVPVTDARVVVTESSPPTSSGRIAPTRTRSSSNPVTVHRFMNISTHWSSSRAQARPSQL
jgi:hypothetical protein